MRTQGPGNHDDIFVLMDTNFSLPSYFAFNLPLLVRVLSAGTAQEAAIGRCHDNGPDDHALL
jgi:hypothetical protein